MGPLTTTTSSGDQTSTGSPQSAVGANNGGTQSSNVQPGTADNLLRSSTGVPLASTSLSVVNLNPANTSTGAALPVVKAKHHVSGPLLGIAALFIVVAIFLFWTAGRSVKTTT